MSNNSADDEKDFGEELLNNFTPFNIENLDEKTIMEEDIFKYVIAIDDVVKRDEVINDLQDKAKELSVLRKFNKRLDAYHTKYIQMQKQAGSNDIEFTNCPLPGLKCGNWKCTDTGITKRVQGKDWKEQSITACSHPILPVQRLVNIEDGTEKIKLAFYKDNKWQNIIVNKGTIANAGTVTQLANRGIEVNSNTSKEFINYIADIINLNLTTIPLMQSTDHLGWCADDFAPYTTNLTYDGDNNFKDAYEAVTTKGDYEKWKSFAKELRSKSKILRFIIATSFASPLIKLLGLNSYIVHLWGGTGTGKTVALMVAMSIWGNPTMGKLVRTLNSTQVALARYASFVSSIPFAGDELQTIKNRWDSFDNLIMYLTEGVDRSRGQQFGGIEQLRSWNCNFLFTGEEPVTKATSGGGVKNRCIEIETTEKLIEDGNLTSNFVRENYGFAGKDFIENLPNQEELQEQYRTIFQDILDNFDTTDKQAMAIASILVADKIISKTIFEDEPLVISDITNWVTSAKEVDTSVRAYEWTLDWISQNSNKFKEDSLTEVWGKIIDDEDGRQFCFVNKKVYLTELSKAGFEFDAIKEKLGRNGQIIISKNFKYTISCRINNTVIRCVKINLNQEENEKENEEERYIPEQQELPF